MENEGLGRAKWPRGSEGCAYLRLNSSSDMVLVHKRPAWSAGMVAKASEFRDMPGSKQSGSGLAAAFRAGKAALPPPP